MGEAGPEATGPTCACWLGDTGIEEGRSTRLRARPIHKQPFVTAEFHEQPRNKAPLSTLWPPPHSQATTPRKAEPPGLPSGPPTHSRPSTGGRLCPQPRAGHAAGTSGRWHSHPHPVCKLGASQGWPALHWLQLAHHHQGLSCLTPAPLPPPSDRTWKGSRRWPAATPHREVSTIYFWVPFAPVLQAKSLGPGQSVCGLDLCSHGGTSRICSCS